MLLRAIPLHHQAGYFPPHLLLRGAGLLRPTDTPRLLDDGGDASRHAARSPGRRTPRTAARCAASPAMGSTAGPFAEARVMRW